MWEILTAIPRPETQLAHERNDEEEYPSGFATLGNRRCLRSSRWAQWLDWRGLSGSASLLFSKTIAPRFDMT
jgi:hypothetical protein